MINLTYFRHGVYGYFMNTSLCKNAIIFTDIFESKSDSELRFARLYHLRSCFLDLIFSINYVLV